MRISQPKTFSFDFNVCFQQRLFSECVACGQPFGRKRELLLQGLALLVANIARGSHCCMDSAFSMASDASSRLVTVFFPWLSCFPHHSALCRLPLKPNCSGRAGSAIHFTICKSYISTLGATGQHVLSLC